MIAAHMPMETDSGSIVYEVAVEVRDDLRETFEVYMTGEHLPDVMATGCFVSARFERAGAGRYRSRFEAASRADLDRYLTEHTVQLREHVKQRFPDGLRFDREQWVTLATF